MKRTLCTVAAGIMLFSMAGLTTGCTKRGEGDETLTGDKLFTQEAPISASQYAEGIKLPVLKNSDLTIMMTVDWNYIEGINTEKSPSAQYHATKIWKELYGTDIQIQTVATESLNDTLATAVASGQSADIIPANETTYPVWNASGLVADLEPYSNYFDLDNSDLYNKALMEQFKWKGKYQWAVTVMIPDKNYIVYNKTKFYLNGVKSPMDEYLAGNWNWTQFVKTAKAMTTADGDYGFSGWGLFPYFAPYSMAAVNEDGSAELKIDDPKYMRYMTEVYNFYQQEKAGRLDWDLQNWGSLFPGGTDAMVMTTLSGFQRIVKSAKALDGDEFGIAPVPIFDVGGETKPISSGFLWAFSISSAAANPKAAATYVRLETLVSRNISKAVPEYGDLADVLTPEEKQMIQDSKNDPVKMDPVLGIGKCYALTDTKICTALYYTVQEQSIQSIFDAAKPQLQAEVDDFNDTAKKAAAAAAQNATATTVAAE